MAFLVLLRLKGKSKEKGKGLNFNQFIGILKLNFKEEHVDYFFVSTFYLPLLPNHRYCASCK